jgi:hypothetical protein
MGYGTRVFYTGEWHAGSRQEAGEKAMIRGKTRNLLLPDELRRVLSSIAVRPLNGKYR